MFALFKQQYEHCTAYPQPTGVRETSKLPTIPILPHKLRRQDVVTVLTSLDVGCWWCVVVCVCPCCVTPDEG